MKRIRALLLAAMGVLALMASVGPAAASASGISFGASEVSVKTGKTLGQVFVFGPRVIGCKYSDFTSSAPKLTETLAASVTLKECGNEFEGNVTVKMNGCKFIYHPAVGNGTFDIGPVGCGPITMEGNYCTRSIFPQTGLAAEFSNEPGSPDTVKFDHKASIQYTITKGGLALCGNSGSVSLNGFWQLKAFNEAGSAVDAEAVPGTGLFMTGEESGEAAKQPKFAAEQYPAVITGPQDSGDKLALTLQGGARVIQCGEAVLSSSLGAASSSLGLNAAYNSCNLTVLGTNYPATFKMNGCSLVLNALNAGPPYSGSLGVACSKEGEAIEINTTHEGSPLCTYKISSQSGLTGVGLTNVGSGTERGVEVDIGVTGLIVTRAKGTTAGCGAPSQSSSYSGTATLHGLS